MTVVNMKTELGTRHAVLVMIFTPSLTGEETESEPGERLDAQDFVRDRWQTVRNTDRTA